MAELGDAWHADDTPPDEVARARETINGLAEPLGRAPDVTTRVTVRITGVGESGASREGYYRGEGGWSGIAGAGEALRAQVEEFRAAGSSHFIAQFEHASVEEHLECLETFDSDVMRPLREAASATSVEGAHA